MKIKDIQIKSDLNLNRWEFNLFLFSLILLIISLYFYFSHLPLKLMVREFSNRKTEIGRLAEQNGSVKSESLGDVGFKPIQKDEHLFNRDVIVTGEASKATLSLTESGSIELGPNTMVTLSFVSSGSLAGINHMPKLTVVAGQIKAKPGEKAFKIANGAQEIIIPEKAPVAPSAPAAQTPGEIGKPAEAPAAVVAEPQEIVLAAAPPPTPVPMVQPDSQDRSVASLEQESALNDLVEIGIVQTSRVLAPTPGSHFSLEVKEGQVVRDLSFRWTTEKESESTQILLWKVSKTSSESELARQLTDQNLVLREHITSQHHDAMFNWKMSAPGYYVWKVRGKNNQDISNDENIPSDFTVEPEYAAIEPRDAVLRTRENGYDVTLNWKTLGEAEHYDTLIYENSSSASPLITQASQIQSVTLNDTQVMSSPVFYYKIRGTQKSGFILTSPLKKIDIVSFPPTPTLPQENSEIDLNSHKEEGVILTWIKDSRFKEYSVEISSDPTFRSIAKQDKVTDNFYLFKNPRPAKYWWRIRGINETTKSDASEGRAFLVKS